MVEIKSSEYRCACKEVIIILNIFSSIKKVIPKEKIQYYEANMDNNHEFEFDYSKTINEQNILYTTKCILANLFKNYIATKEDKNEINRREKEERKNIEIRKRELYNPNTIFEKKPNSDKNNNVNNTIKMDGKKINNITNVSLVIEKKNIFIKIKEKILTIIKMFK